MITLKKIYTYLFLIGWFFFPFNDFQGINALGEFKNESASFFFIAGFLVLGINTLFTGKIGIPYKSTIFQVIFLFLFWCFLTIVFNYSTVQDSYYKHTPGFYRFIRQYFSLLLAVFFFSVFFWNVIRKWDAKQVLFKIRQVLLYCLIFTFVYGFLETLIVVFHINFLRGLLGVFDYFPFLTVKYAADRISSVAYESPSLGNYLITVSGWMFSYILTSKNKYRFIPTLMVLFLTFFSGSRTALINISLQFIIFISILYAMPNYRVYVIKGFKYFFVLSSLMLIINSNKIINAVNEKIESLNFSDNLKKNISNQSRFGMQYASIQVFKENPIVGVGFGQETYHKRFHYPGWAKKNNWEFKGLYENSSIASFPPAYNLYTRMLSETGIIGLLILLSLIYLCISKSIRIYKNSMNEEKVLAFILIISFIGLSLNWLQTDFFRQYGFWLCAMILIRLTQGIKENSLAE